MMRNRPGRGATAGLLYTEGNPGLSIPATVVGDLEMNNIQEELANLIESRGITLDSGDTTQLEQAIDQTIIDLGLGTAAFVDHGTAAGEVPLNSDLGNSSTRDVGTATGTVAAGNDSRFHSNANDPTSNQKAALAGNAPSGSNKYATIADLITGYDGKKVLKSTRTSPGTWSITGLTAGIEALITMNISGLANANWNNQFTVSGAVGTNGAAAVIVLGPQQSANTCTLIPTGTTLTLGVTAYQQPMSCYQ